MSGRRVCAEADWLWMGKHLATMWTRTDSVQCVADVFRDRCRCEVKALAEPYDLAADVVLGEARDDSGCCVECAHSRFRVVEPFEVGRQCQVDDEISGGSRLA